MKTHYSYEKHKQVTQKMYAHKRPKRQEAHTTQTLLQTKATIHKSRTTAHKRPNTQTLQQTNATTHKRYNTQTLQKCRLPNEY